jgi:hypothetical protein
LPQQFVTVTLFASSHAWFWDNNQAAAKPSAPVRQLPISYIRAFAYHPVAFPQPLAPITTYHVSRNPQNYIPNRNFPSSPSIGGAIAQGFQQQFFQNQDSSPSMPQPPTQQQLPLTSQVEFGTLPTTTSLPSTTTPTPTPTVPTPAFSGSSQTSQFSNRVGFADGPGYQRQLQQSYQSGNFGGFPQYQTFNQPSNQFQYNDQVQSNQFSGRLFGSEPNYQQYTSDPLTYQFIPTSITPMQNQNNVKFVPCMCPVAVSISSSPLMEKRSEDIPLLQPTTDSEATQSSSQQFVEETK